MSARIRADLLASLAQEGLHIVCPVRQAAIDAAGVPVSLRQLLPDAGDLTGLVIGDGGGDFFRGFRRAGAPGSDPLDDYTRRVVPAALQRALPAQMPFAIRFPFATDRPPLPIQQLGRAAGLPAPGPLGLQIHPRYGPWWAYRAFAVIAVALPEEDAVASPCHGCPRPCVAACPGGAVQIGGFAVGSCTSRRLADQRCQHSCAARLSCPVGAEVRYPAEQLAFHMSASLAQIRRG
jgi:epoxyqueuosine reductase